MGDALSDYMHAISRIPLLTAAEEVHLATIIQQWQNHPDPEPALKRRGRRALDRMVEGNLRLVVSICKRYQNMANQAQIEMLDLIQAGSLGLIRAVRGFDPSRGYKFSTYGYWWIRQSISRHIKERGQAIRVPPEITNLARRIQEHRALDPQAGSLESTAERLGLSLQRLEEVLRIHHISHMVSLDQVCAASGDGEHTLLDLIRGDDGPSAQETYEWLHYHLRELKPEEQRVLQLRFSPEGDYSFSQVAAQLGLKKSQVQWLEKHALRKLQKRLREGRPTPGREGGARLRPA
jgi:RNA polymerase sigma factor (sigma-70 family)